MKVIDNYIYCVENALESRKKVKNVLERELTFEALLQSGFIKLLDGDQISFNFVGLICIEDKLICILPKYYGDLTHFSDAEILAEFIGIFKILRKVRANASSIFDFNYTDLSQRSELSEIVLADKIIKDYLTSGIFSKNVNVHQINGDGEIDWNFTIDQFDPVFSRKAPIYYDYYTSSSFVDEYNIIAELHKFAIKLLLDKYGAILEYDFPYLEDSVPNISDLGSIAYLQDIVVKEMNLVYVDRDVMLLNNLLNFLKKQQNHVDDLFEIYGTEYFNIVWEKACSSFFFNKISEFKELMPTPKWWNDSGQFVVKEKLRPDIVTYVEDDDRLFILDAKYYLIKYEDEPFNVTGNPGIADVSKQFLYEESLRGLKFSRIHNAFLFPKLQPDLVSRNGYITLELFSDKKIISLNLSANAVFNHFLKDLPISTSDLNQIISLL